LLSARKTALPGTNWPSYLRRSRKCPRRSWGSMLSFREGQVTSSLMTALTTRLAWDWRTERGCAMCSDFLYHQIRFCSVSTYSQKTASLHHDWGWK